MNKYTFTMLTLVIVAEFLVTCHLMHASEFIPLGFFSDANFSRADAVSDDGTVVTGHAGPEDEGSFTYIQPFRWTDSGGMERLGSLDDKIQSYSNGISGDGSTIVGTFGDFVGNGEAFIWTESDGMDLLGGRDSKAEAASFDGSVVVGSRRSRGFRWTKDDGFENLGDWHAYDVSDDGAVIAGVRRTGQLVRWTAETGEVEIGVDFVPDIPRVSPDGSVIVGSERTTDDPFHGPVEAIRWTEDSGVTRLGHLATDYSNATGTNLDGSIIIGQTRRNEGEITSAWSWSRGFVWTEQFGMKPIEQVLVEQHGLELNGYTLNAPLDISPSGRFIVGGGVNSDGDEEAWLVRLDSPLGTLLGDFNGDTIVDVGDIDLLQAAIRTGSSDLQFDLDHSNAVDVGDLFKMVSSVLGTWFGDANLDGEFNSSDLVAVFEEGQYEDGVIMNSGWAQGDWNGDGDFTTPDLVTAFTDGGYEQGPRASVNAVPEPSSLLLLSFGMLGLRFSREGRTKRNH